MQKQYHDVIHYKSTTAVDLSLTMTIKLFSVASVCLLICSCCCALSATEQLIGDWDLRIKPNRGKLGGEHIPNAIFPSQTTKRSRPMECRLSLHPNGTFSLTPQEGMPMNGWWELGRNPYCPTDRFYDDLLLKSYPRSQKEGDAVLQHVMFSAKCRIYGRYSGHDRRVGRINHGTLLWRDCGLDAPKPRNIWDWWNRNRVCASFTGRTIEGSADREGGG